MPKKKAPEPPIEPVDTTEEEFNEFVKYLTTRNAGDPKVSRVMVESFIASMNVEHIQDLKDVIEIYIKLDRHAAEFWDIKNKRKMN